MERFERNDKGKFICPWNKEAVSCADRKCHKCGWHPMVAKYRTLKVRYELLKKEVRA